MKSLYLLRGIPGCGKSTLAEELSEGGKYPILSADMYFEDANGNYNWEPTQLKDAHGWCLGETELIMATWKVLIGSGRDVNTGKGYFRKFESGEKIFVANTFTTESEMQPYYDLAGKYGYTVFSIIVENRHGGKNTHNVPETTIEKMRNRFNIKL